jgi:hypothetical protein
LIEPNLLGFCTLVKKQYHGLNTSTSEGAARQQFSFQDLTLKESWETGEGR